MKLISDTAEYALRAVVWLAQEPVRGWTTKQIADGTQAPPDYLAKILKQLAHAGLLKAQRGCGGGFRLEKAPDEVSVLEVVDAVDPLERICACPLGRADHSKQLCPLHRRIDAAAEQVQIAFSGVTLADLIVQGASAAPLCR